MGDFFFSRVKKNGLCSVVVVHNNKNHTCKICYVHVKQSEELQQT